MHHPHIIGLSGPAGSGKDTIAGILVECAGFTQLAFADTLRTEVMLAFAIDPSFLTQRETKEMPLRCLAIGRCLDEGFVARMIVMHTLNSERLDLDAPRSPRQIMQWWGTDYRRQQQHDYWVSGLLKRAHYLVDQNPGIRIVVTDCRFQDEVDAVRFVTERSQIWQVWREGVAIAPGAHVSEVTGYEFRPDVLIRNCTSLKRLHARVMEAWADGLGAGQGA